MGLYRTMCKTRGVPFWRQKSTLLWMILVIAGLLYMYHTRNQRGNHVSDLFVQNMQGAESGHNWDIHPGRARFNPKFRHGPFPEQNKDKDEEDDMDNDDELGDEDEEGRRQRGREEKEGEEDQYINAEDAGDENWDNSEEDSNEFHQDDRGVYKEERRKDNLSENYDEREDANERVEETRNKFHDRNRESRNRPNYVDKLQDHDENKGYNRVDDIDPDVYNEDNPEIKAPGNSMVEQQPADGDYRQGMHMVNSRYDEREGHKFNEDNIVHDRNGRMYEGDSRQKAFQSEYDTAETGFHGRDGDLEKKRRGEFEARMEEGVRGGFRIREDLRGAVVDDRDSVDGEKINLQTTKRVPLDKGGFRLPPFPTKRVDISNRNYQIGKNKKKTLAEGGFELPPFPVKRVDKDSYGGKGNSLNNDGFELPAFPNKATGGDQDNSLTAEYGTKEEMPKENNRMFHVDPNLRAVEDKRGPAIEGEKGGVEGDVFVRNQDSPIRQLIPPNLNVVKKPKLLIKNKAEVVDMNLPEDSVLQAWDLSKLEATFHDYVKVPQVQCDFLARLGDKGHGGWDICHTSEFQPRQPCLVYSFGFDLDYSFEDEVATRYGCETHSFDPSVNKLLVGVPRSSTVVRHNYVLSDANGVTPNGWTVRTLSRIREELDHHQPIDILKVDIEENEWKAVPEMVKSGVLGSVRQFLLEVHVLAKGRSAPSAPAYIKFLQLLRQLYTAGFRIVSTRGDDVQVKSLGERTRPQNYEISFVRRR